MFMEEDIWIISLLGRQSFLLSSSTVFMFSIQMASTGPSRIIHLRSLVGSEACSRNRTANTPSTHSPVMGSACPYNCPMVTDFGFTVDTYTISIIGKKTQQP